MVLEPAPCADGAQRLELRPHAPVTPFALGPDELSPGEGADGQ